MFRSRHAGWLAIAFTAVAVSVICAAEPSEAILVVAPDEATVGDHLSAKVILSLAAGDSFEPVSLDDAFGPFEVLNGSWDHQPPEVDTIETWVWSGTLTTYETGEKELPAIRVPVRRGDETVFVSTEPVAVTVTSVLPGGEDPEALEPADLKGPASIPPDYGSLMAALGALGALALGAGLYWWLHRRLHSRLAAVEQPDDPFRRLPPHTWVYEELKRLLARRLAEEGHVDLFYEELARILKQYLGGRYRVDLMESTTEEVPWLLGQAGAPEDASVKTRDFFHRCDLVKFAGRTPGPDEVRSAVEEAYGIVDATRPSGEPEWPTAQGAA